MLAPYPFIDGSQMSQSPHMVKDSVSGADYFLRGFSLIRQPGIRTFVLIPLLVNFVLFAGAFYALLLQLDGLFAWLHQQIPSWLSWLDYLLWPIALITILVVFSFIFSSVINWIAAPLQRPAGGEGGADPHRRGGERHRHAGRGQGRAAHLQPRVDQAEVLPAQGHRLPDPVPHSGWWARPWPLCSGSCSAPG